MQPSSWFRWHAHRIHPGDRVLDFACGDGRHSLAAAERGANVIAVDRDLRRLATGQKHATARGLPIDWRDLDLEGPWPDWGIFDAVLVFNYLDRANMPRILQLVAPGGLLILASADYGSGSSRDWAAKGTLLLGVKAVLATSFERIHRTNLIGMGVLPLQFNPGQSPQSLGLTGEETYAITGLAGANPLPRQVTVRIDAEARSPKPAATEFTTTVRIDTPAEAAYYRHGGILPYVLRQIRDR